MRSRSVASSYGPVSDAIDYAKCSVQRVESVAGSAFLPNSLPNLGALEKPAAFRLSKFCKAKRNCGLAGGASPSRLRHGKKGNTNPNQRKREIEMKTLPAILIGLMASLAIGVTTARGQVMYSLEDLGVVKDMELQRACRD